MRYPRIMIASDVVADVSARGKGENAGWGVMEAIAQADDGPRYLDALLELNDSIIGPAKGEIRVQNIARYEAMADRIQLRFDEAFDNPRHFEKVQWFAKYWNRTVKNIGVKKINGPGSDPRPAVSG